MTGLKMEYLTVGYHIWAHPPHIYTGPHGASDRDTVQRAPGRVRGDGWHSVGVGHPQREGALPDLRARGGSTVVAV